jgi:hypothetical protein
MMKKEVPCGYVPVEPCHDVMSKEETKDESNNDILY